MGNTYIFHEVLDKKINVNQDDILTFDDGHYSILQYVHRLRDLPNRKIIFVTPNFVSLEKRIWPYENIRYYMDDFFIFGRRRQFLNLFELEDLCYGYGFEIGMHSFYHDIVYYPRGRKIITEEHGNHKWHTYKLPPGKNKKMYKVLVHTSALAEPGMIFDKEKQQLRRRTPAEFKEYVEEDTSKCIEWFQKYFGGVDSYAYPFFQSSEYLNKVLKENGITEIYGQRKDYYSSR